MLEIIALMQHCAHDILQVCQCLTVGVWTTNYLEHLAYSQASAAVHDEVVGFNPESRTDMCAVTCAALCCQVPGGIPLYNWVRKPAADFGWVSVARLLSRSCCRCCVLYTTPGARCDRVVSHAYAVRKAMTNMHTPTVHLVHTIFQLLPVNTIYVT